MMSFVMAYTYSVYYLLGRVSDECFTFLILFYPHNYPYLYGNFFYCPQFTGEEAENISA